MKTIVPMKVYQPFTEILIGDNESVLIKQTDFVGGADESVYVQIDKLFLPVLIEWLKNANDSLNCTNDTL